MSYKKIAIVQSNYIPWKGYFDFINMVDEFVLYDDAQYTKRDWRNRNKIKTSEGVMWLTIPVEVKGKFYQKIKDTKISDLSWGKKHWQIISRNYSRANYFKEFKDLFETMYNQNTETFLSMVNYSFICAINELLGIKTKITWSSAYEIGEGKTEKLIRICKQAGANEYISGPLAKNYIEESLFEKENIKLSWMDYSGYPVYTQLFGEFEHGVTILDLIFNEGRNAVNFMKSFKQNVMSSNK